MQLQCSLEIFPNFMIFIKYPSRTFYPKYCYIVLYEFIQLFKYFLEEFCFNTGGTVYLRLLLVFFTGFREEKYIHEVKYYKYRSAITKFRISAHTFPVESGRWDKTPCEKRMCPLCFSNDIGNEKHYIFHCTNPKLVEIRKTFTPEIYETFTPYPDVNSINDMLF